MKEVKIYLASAISDIARKSYQKEIAKHIEDKGFSVYAASTNDSINDKSNNPTPRDIYKGDISEIVTSDYFLALISGAGEDGTISEIGFVSGWNENNSENPIEIIAVVTNERLLQPQFYEGISSAGYNHLVLGMIDKWGKVFNNLEEALEYIKNKEVR